MSWRDRVKGIQIGETVWLSRDWLTKSRRSGSYFEKAEGVVTAVQESDGRRLATVNWNRPGIPDLVNAINLSKVKPCGAE